MHVWEDTTDVKTLCQHFQHVAAEISLEMLFNCNTLNTCWFVFEIKWICFCYFGENNKKKVVVEINKSSFEFIIF